MEDTLPGVIEAFSSKGLAAPHPGRIVHFEEGFESHALYGIASELAKKRLFIFGRKNRKIFDKEYAGFFDALPRRVGEGFDFRCLFLNPNAPEAILSSAHSDADFSNQLRNCIKRAEECLEGRGLSPGRHLRFYSTHRTVSLIVVDDAVLFTPIDVTEDGRTKPLTKCGFSVVDCRLSLGRNLLNRFLETWKAASPSL